MSLLGNLAVVERGEHFKLPQLHLRELGLKHVPAVPVDLAALPDTLIKLGLREKQCEQAYQSLSRTFTIAGMTDRAHAFLFGPQAAGADRAAARATLQAFLSSGASEISLGALAERLKEQDEALSHGANGGAGDQLTALALDDKTQWSMSWTTFPDVYSAGRPRLEEWAATVDVAQADKASSAFFPTIAREGLAYNLLLLKKVDSADVVTWRDLFGADWTPALDGGSASRAAVRDRSTDLRGAATPAGRRRSPVHPEHRRRPRTGRRDQGSDARADPCRGGRQPREDLQPTGLDHRLRLGLRPPGGEGLPHGLRHLDRSRLPVAHRHRRHADDDV